MCGIAGIFVMSGRAPGSAGADAPAPVRLAELEAMAASMRHRGPDFRKGQVLDERTGFAHARLAILDLVPESNQPMEIDDGAYVITFNGEIFNYIELRAQLESLGHRFRTNSDTEVLLRAYVEWGESVSTKLNGMWAFAIFDRKRDVLFCSRDRFGVKPFCYTRQPSRADAGRSRFLFASEMKALFAIAPELARPDYESLSLLLRASMGGRRPHTAFEGIERLSPAHNMVVRRDGITITRYWDYPTCVNDDITPTEAALALRDLLTDSIRLRMRSDVPVGTTLSGGVDSSSIVCLLRRFHDGPHDTFTACYEGEPYDESPVAADLARSLGMTPNLLPAVSEGFLPTLRRIVRHLEAPIYSPAVFPLWNIMKAARKKVTVVLEGQGADELLGGYVRECVPYLAADQLRRGRVLTAGATLLRQARRAGWKETSLWTARAAAPGGHRWFRRARGDEAIYTGALADAAPAPAPRSDPPIRDRLNAALRAQHEGTLVDLLHYGDAVSMAHSIESRLPFMDYRLVEFAFRLPGRLKVRAGEGKVVLRDAVRSIVPDHILDARKLGFVTPIAKWFRERPETTVDPILRSEACRERGIFDPGALAKALDAHRRGEADLSYNIYRWIITEVWFQEFIDSGGAALPVGEPEGTPDLVPALR